MFKRPRFIILASIAFYAISLCVVWWQVSVRANRRMLTMLESAELGYSDVVDGEIDAALRYVGGAIMNILGDTSKPRTLAQMQELSQTFNIDEINIVNAKGVVIGSNIPSVLGYDFNSHPLTREFLALTNAHRTIVSQPFRHGTVNPEMFCKYHGISFPGRPGFLQLGITVDRLRQNMYTYTDEESDRLLKEWHFSVMGWYERVLDNPDFVPGKIFRRRSAETGEMQVGRYFDYRGYKYAALLPESYCYAQRNASFLVTALVIGVLLFFFTYILVRLARLAETARRRTAADLAIARTIQMSALPSDDGAFMECLEFSLTAECRPAREVGGDFYDFFYMPGDRLVILVADVSGKGISGAMFMMEAKNVLKSCLIEHADITEAVAVANQRLCASNKAEMFVTAWIGIVDRNGIIEYVNAGHNRPFIRHADGEVEKIMGKGGRFLGMFEDAAYRANVVELKDGDLLYLYTDGITEAMNAKGEQFGEARLKAAFSGFNDDIARAVASFVGTAERSDDMTELMLRWNGAGESSQKTFPSTESSLGAAVDFIRAELAGAPAKTVAAILNAADEITSNIVNYSGATSFTISVERAYDRLRLVFTDNGRAYNPLSHVDPDTHAAIEDRSIGGLGLVVVKRLVDRISYVRENEQNILTLLKRK